MRRGVIVRLPKDHESGAPLHTLVNVYREMLLQVTRDYPGLPDVRTLTLAELRFFYEGLHPELLKYSKLRDDEK